MDKKFLILFVGLFLVLLSSFILAAGAVTMTSPVANGNYSNLTTSTLNLTCLSAMENALNVSFVYNASGGAVNTTNFVATITNLSANQSNFNQSIDISSLSDATTYNITCRMENATGDIVYATAVANVTIDNHAPAVNVTRISGVHYSTQTRANGTFVLNVTITDTINATTVFFNLTNSSGAQDAIFYAARSAGTNDWVNSTGFNISKYTQSSYTITVYANDSLNNLNSSESSGTIYFDSASPSSIVITETSHGSTSLSLSVAASDATSGVSSCIVDRSGASISGSGNSWTITETGLSCGNSYSYIVTCTDMAGNSGASSSTSFSTTGCSSAGTTGSPGASTAQWTNTYVVENTNFESGYSKQLFAKQRLKVSLGTETHYVGVKSLTASSAVIEVSSDPIEVTLDVGEDAKVDFDTDGFYDIYVKLLGITNNKADVSVQKISEAVPEESEGSVSTTGEVGDTTTSTTGEETTTQEGRSLTWLWVIIILVVVGIGVWFFLNKKK